MSPLVLWLSLTLFLAAGLPAGLMAGDLEDGLGYMVKDFERHIGKVPPGQKYSVVVRFFNTEENRQPVRICSRIEAIMIYHLVERFAGRDMIEVLDRARVEAADAEIAFQADPLRGGAGEWAKKFGQKKGAGFLITGTTAMMSRVSLGNQPVLRVNMDAELRALDMVVNDIQQFRQEQGKHGLIPGIRKVAFYGMEEPERRGESGPSIRSAFRPLPWLAR